jgi:hypothetical protein
LHTPGLNLGLRTEFQAHSAYGDTAWKLQFGIERWFPYV